MLNIETSMRKKNPEPPLNYESAWAELQQIVLALQNGSIGIDELSTQIERASELVSFCRERLRETEAAVGRLGK